VEAEVVMIQRTVFLKLSSKNLLYMHFSLARGIVTYILPIEVFMTRSKNLDQCKLS